MGFQITETLLSSLDVLLLVSKYTLWILGCFTSTKMQNRNCWNKIFVEIKKMIFELIFGEKLLKPFLYYKIAVSGILYKIFWLKWTFIRNYGQLKCRLAVIYFHVDLLINYADPCLNHIFLILLRFEFNFNRFSLYCVLSKIFRLLYFWKRRVTI